MNKLTESKRVVWHQGCFGWGKYKSMSINRSNRYCFVGKVVEVIYKDNTRIPRVICTPGSLILELPEQENLQLETNVKITGSFRIESLEEIKD